MALGAFPNANERAAMAQLSVFVGPFDAEAARHVLDLGGAATTSDIALQGLVDAAMVVQRPDHRFDLLHSLRAYASHRLTPRTRRAAEQRHGEWFARLGSPDAIEQVVLVGHSIRLDRITRDLDDLVAAHQRAVARQDAHTARCCALAAWSSLQERGSAPRGEQLLREAAAMPGAHHRVRLEAARAQIRDGEFESAAHAIRTIAATESDPADRALTLEALAHQAQRQGQNDQAKRRFEEVIDRFASIGDGPGQSRAMSALGNLVYDRGQLADGERHYLANLELNRDLGSVRGIAIAYNSLGNVSYGQGRYETARGHYGHALKLFRQVGNRASEAIALGNLGGLLHRMGLVELSRAHYEARLRNRREMGNRSLEGWCRDGLGQLAFTTGHPAEAIAHYETALAIQQEHQGASMAARVRQHLGMALLDQGQIAAAHDQLSQSLATNRSLRSARSVALALQSLGQVALVRGDRAEADARFEEAIVEYEALGRPSDVARVRLELARLYVLSARLDKAQAAWVQAASGATSADATFATHVLEVRAALDLAATQPSAARDALYDAMVQVRSRGDRHWAGRIHLAMARTYATAVDWEKVVTQLDLSWTALEEVHSTRWLVEVLADRSRAAFELGDDGPGETFLAQALALGVHRECTAESPVSRALERARSAR